MKSMGVMDPKNVQLTPMPDGTQALHRPRSGSSAPLAIYDPKQKSLTVQAQNGVLSEEARRMVRNIAGAPGSALEASMPVYFGHGPHATEAEFSSLVEAGKQAHEAARTPEERATALDKLGLSPAGVKKQMEAGTLSFQQGRLLNGAFNGVMEHDSTLPGTQAALKEWVSHPNNKHMAQWLHEGTPEQRAYVAGQFFKQTRQRAEGSLLATPERMEEVRRGHLGGLHPDWGKPGAAAPGSAPDDGPAGLERIPLQGGGAAHMPSGTWTAHDYETLDQHPDIRKLPHAEREAAVDTLLSQYHEQLTSQPGFNAADQQKFNQTAQALRDRVAALKTWGDTAGEGADLVKDAAKSEVGTHLAAGADLSIFDPYGNLRMPGKNLKEQSVYETQKVKDTAQRLAQPAAEKKIDAALEAIHQDIRNGHFPLAPGEAQDKWIDELSAKLNPQRQQWFDAVQGPADPNTPEGKKHLAHLQQQSLASPENRALIQEFIRTGNMARWKELEHNLKKTPQRAQTEEDQQNSLKNDPLIRGLSDAAGTDLGEYMQGAPGTVAGYFVPGMGSLGKGSRMGRLARRAAGIAANIGGTVAQNTIENPDSDFEDHKRAVIADYATSLGMKPLQKGAGWAGQTIKDHLPHRPGAGNPGSPDSAPPPSEGQTFEERLALEDGNMPFPPMDTAQPQPVDATGQPPSSQQTIPDTTTPTTPDSDSEKQPQTTANDGKPPQTAPSPRESDLPKFGAAQNTIEKLKAQQSPLNPDQQKELAAAEHTVASTIEYNLLRKQAVIEKRGRTLHPTEAAALKNAQATLARLAPAGTNAPPANSAEAGTATPNATHPQNNIPNVQAPNNSSTKDSQSEQADIDTFSDNWTPPLKSSENNLSQTDSVNNIKAADDGQKRSRDIDGENELPYWKEYYEEVGRDKENLEPLLNSIRAHGEIMKGPSHQGINIEESNQARYIPIRDHNNKIAGHTITHGPSTKKWELMEEFAHYKVTQGWKAEEIQDLKKKLDKGIRTPTGRWEKMKNTKDAAEEIIIKQHLLDHASSLKPADKKLLQNQIKQLSLYGLSKRY